MCPLENKHRVFIQTYNNFNFVARSSVLYDDSNNMTSQSELSELPFYLAIVLIVKKLSCKQTTSNQFCSEGQVKKVYLKKSPCLCASYILKFCHIDLLKLM